MAFLFRHRGPTVPAPSKVPGPAAGGPTSAAADAITTSAISTASTSAARKDAAGPTSLLSLPPEIHVMISRQLIYPDALSLKHTNSYFGRMVDTGVRLKVEWLMERRMLHLECPNNTRCDLGSDLRFCRGSVALLMQRRREHLECESRPGLGCLVYGTSRCTHRGTLATRMRRWLRTGFTIELWWVLLAFIPVVLGWLWTAEILAWLSASAWSMPSVGGDW